MIGYEPTITSDQPTTNDQRLFLLRRPDYQDHTGAQVGYPAIVALKRGNCCVVRSCDGSQGFTLFDLVVDKLLLSDDSAALRALAFCGHLTRFRRAGAYR